MKKTVLTLLAVLIGFSTAPARADEDNKAVIIKTPNTTYIINTKSERMRQALLNADRIKIKNRDRDDKEDYYKNYYKHHKYIRDHEKNYRKPQNRASYNSGYAAGYFMSDD